MEDVSKLFGTFNIMRYEEKEIAHDDEYRKPCKVFEIIARK